MNGEKIVGYVDMTPTHAAICPIFMNILERPDDCSDCLDEDDLEDAAYCRKERQGLANAKEQARGHFRFLSQLVDAMNLHMDKMPQEFKDACDPILAEYRADEQTTADAAKIIADKYR